MHKGSLSSMIARYVALVLFSACLIARGLAADPPGGSFGPTSAPLIWTGTAPGTGGINEAECIEGFNADSFTLTVTGTEAEWAGKFIEIRVQWLLPVNDYDLYVHKGDLNGPLVGTSGGGVPGTSEATAIVPMDHGSGTYTVHVLYFATTPGVDQYRGIASIGTLALGRSAIYLKGGGAFSPNVTVQCPVAERDGEPSSRSDALGNYYISAIRGVPAGCDLWWFDLRPNSPTYDPFMRNPIYRGQPDAFTDEDAVQVGADGGGDVDLAVGFGNGPGGVPTLAFTSLVASNISTARSYDLGQTWVRNPGGNVTGGIPVDDRQWIEFWAHDKVYLLYRTIAPAVTQIQLSRDGGLTYGPARTAGMIGQVGAIDVDQNDGTVYICGSTGQVAIGRVDPFFGEPTNYEVVQVGEDLTGVANIFTIVKVADDGTVYFLYCNGRDVMLRHSADKGRTWSVPVRVSDGDDNRATLFPHMETGPKQGSVGVVWYGTSSPLNIDSADWHVFYAYSENADSRVPTFRQIQVSDHVIHAANISTGGTLGSANRNLLDYFQVCFDPVGAAVVGYTDDHNDFGGHSFVSRQIAGPNSSGKKLKRPREGSQLPPPWSPPADGSQVTDFPNDVAYGLLAVVNQPDPFDILSIKYSTETTATNKFIVGTMKVSKLNPLPDLTNWRMHFAANVPGAGTIGANGYSFGASDRGDMFWMRAFTRADRTSGSAWGTTVRNSDGSLTNTDRGPADAFSFDLANNTITVKIAVSKLNLAATRGPIVPGSVIAGLRGLTYTSGHQIGKRDITRGGGEFVVQ